MLAFAQSMSMMLVPPSSGIRLHTAFITRFAMYASYIMLKVDDQQMSISRHGRFAFEIASSDLT